MEFTEMADSSSLPRPSGPQPGFFIGDDKVTLKHVFDNLRNYAICSLLFLGAAYAFTRSRCDQMDPTYMSVAGAALMLVSLLFCFLNVLQSYFIGQRSSKQVDDFVRGVTRGRHTLTKLAGGIASLAYFLVVSLLQVAVISGGIAITSQGYMELHGRMRASNPCALSSPPAPPLSN